MSFRNHLRANQDVELSGSKVAKHLLIGALGANRVAIQTRDPRAGEFLAQFFFELLRAGSEKINVLRAALRAGLRHAP